MRTPVIAIHQPNFAPWLGWFAKAARADTLVLLGNVQFNKASYTHRVRMKSTVGPRLVTVPIAKGSHRRVIDDLEIAPGDTWARDHVRRLEDWYGHSVGWAPFGVPACEILLGAHTRLGALNRDLIAFILEALDISTPIVDAASLGPRTASGSDGNLQICTRLEAGSYLSGSGGRSFNDGPSFDRAGIDLVYTRFEHPVYAQPHGGFEAGLSALDLLFSAGPDAPAVFRSGLRDPIPA